MRLKTFLFTSSQEVQAETEEEACERFANDSLDFSANAECTELYDDSNKVVITVTGGVAEVKKCPEDVEVEIIDLDV